MDCWIGAAARGEILMIDLGLMIGLVIKKGERLW